MVACTIAIAIIVISAPYLMSRLAAPSRRIQTFSDPIITTEHNDGVLRIATYNIAHGRGATNDNWQESGDAKPARISRIAQLLKQIDADIVILPNRSSASWDSLLVPDNLVPDNRNSAIELHSAALHHCFV